MEFPFDVSRTLREPVTAWERSSLLQLPKETASRLKEIVDRMGAASSKAQGLNTPVTTYNVLLQTPDQKLYIFVEGKVVAGIIKVGRKKLFIRQLQNELDMHREISPLCVLDFYVHESLQRTGRGKMLFEAMLERENLPPYKLGYDRPSTKFISFLRKHYGLVDFTPQANNYVVFKRYFEDSRTPSRNEQPNASVSMRPLTAPQKPRRNSFDATTTQPRMQPNTTSYYSPQKPQSRPESVTPLPLHNLPKNGPSPYSIKTNLPAKIPPPSNPNPTANGYHDDNEYDNEERDYNDQEEREDYQNGNEETNYNNNTGYADEYNDRDSNYKNNNNNQYDDSIAPEDYENNIPRKINSLNSTFSSTSAASSYTPFATTSSNYGSHSPSFKRPSSPSRRPTPSSQYISPSSSISSDSNHFARANSYNSSMNLQGNGIFGLSSSGSLEQTRGRSPSRRSDSPFDSSSPSLSRASSGGSPAPQPPYATSPASSRQRSNSVDRTHAPPKGMGTLGGFSQPFNYPMKFEKELAEPPHRAATYQDNSILPPKRETVQPRSPAYRLSAASRINSREMDHLENSMRNALSTIESHEKRVDLINDSGYRAISPEPKARQDAYQSPQSRSIFSTVQPTGSPAARSVSPARFGNTNREEQQDSSFSRTDVHKRFHSENPSLMSTSPMQPRVHPNSRSRQSPFPT